MNGINLTKQAVCMCSNEDSEGDDQFKPQSSPLSNPACEVYGMLEKKAGREL
jgi:hypothetical protein